MSGEGGPPPGWSGAYLAISARSFDGWDLQVTCTLAGVKLATQSWETDRLLCTPEGIVAELSDRDVLHQLTDTTRKKVADATRLLEEFDVLNRAGDTDPAE